METFDRELRRKALPAIFGTADYDQISEKLKKI
jgi:hypothetical protein